MVRNGKHQELDMREKKHVITVAVVFVLAVATGVTAYFVGYHDQGQKQAALTKHDFKTDNGTCHVKGTVRNFIVECDKDIEHINYRNMKSKYLAYFGPGEDGKKENIEMIVVNLKNVKGSDKNKDKLSFSLTHMDDSTTDITLK